MNLIDELRSLPAAEPRPEGITTGHRVTKMVAAYFKQRLRGFISADAQLNGLNQDPPPGPGAGLG